MKSHFLMFAAYNQWANARLYDAAAALTDSELRRDMGAAFGSILGTLNHILVADRIWMKRFTGSGNAPATLDAILEAELPKLLSARQVEDRRILEWVTQLTETALAERFTYTMITDMRTVSQSLAPALAHLFNHQTHHRGQAHALLTALGQPSITLDLIYFQRSPEGQAFA